VDAETAEMNADGVALFLHILSFIFFLNRDIITVLPHLAVLDWTEPFVLIAADVFLSFHHCMYVIPHNNHTRIT
jgi:hypothetical protein